MKREVRLYLGGLAAFALGGAMLDAVFNNFLDSRFGLDGFRRTVLEVPRELPGLLVVVVSALLSFLPSRRLAAAAGVFSFAGLLLLGHFSTSFWMAMPWLFFYSIGQHLFMPLQQSIGMALSEPGKAGQMLGFANGLRNASIILGSAIVFVGFRFFDMDFATSMTLGAVAFALGAWAFLRMDPGARQPAAAHLELHRNYRLYYLLCILFGTRKQIFLTFAPWVLVSVFQQPTQVVAELLTIGGAVGVVVQPLVGRMLDRMGERFTLGMEALILIPVCLGYAMARDLFAPDVALWIVFGCFLADQVLMSFGMARSTYLRRVATNPSHVTPTLSMGVSIDHIFSIAIALFGGALWRLFGEGAVFYLGAVIATVNWFVTRRIPSFASWKAAT